MLEVSIDGGELPLEPAERVWVGKYELLSRLGAGGMAEVFLARTIAIHGFEKLAALKRIRPDWAENELLIEMLLQEARLAATLVHPNVAQVYDVGEDEGSVFFTMEYVAGKDLRRVVQAAVRQRQKLPLGHVLHVIIGCAAGLHYAHEHRAADGTPLHLVHRDVSPSNILVSYDGTPKIVDFGIAKVATSGAGEVAPGLRGKVPYMSPEQCRGAPLDRRSDIFSLGIILWELTVGRRLFSNLKGQDVELARHIATTPAIRPSSIHPDYPPELERIVMKALALEVGERYQSALDFELDLEEFAREQRLVTSQARLAETMRQLFADEIRAEEEAVQGYLSQNQATPPPPRTATRGHVVVTAASASLADEPSPTRPVWQRPGALVVVLALLFLAAVVIVQSGVDGAPAAAKPPSKASSGRAWEDDSPILQNTPTSTRDPAARTILVAPTGEEGTTGRIEAAAPSRRPSSSKNSRRKSKQKPPAGWDPNSPLPPP